MTFWVTFWLWVASFVITDYFRQRLPTVTPSGLGDFTVPTATEGRFVPLVFGTMLIEGPNVVWYGDFSYEELTVETGIIFKDDETVGYKYFMGLQMGICRGRVAGIRRIWVGDDIVWDYTLDNGSVLGTVCDVDKPDLFGGTKEGGGFIGRFRLYDGSQTSVSPYLATQINANNLPAHTGFSYIVFSNQTEDGGGEIGEANSLRRMKFEVQTYDTMANGGLGDSLGMGNDHHFIDNDLNPVVLAYDVFTNTDWGRGLSPSEINVVQFEQAAETVWTEGYGFSMVQDQVTTSKEILDLIEQHIDGYIGPNPETGLIEVNLARQDYNINASPAEVFFADETNVISVEKFSRGENNQTFNEVRVQYLDRTKNYGDTYAPAQDLANLAIQGRRKSRINRMPGVHDPDVASKIAWRDLRGATRALASATVEINREGWNLRPGDVIALTDDEVGVTNLPMRITAVRQGDPLNASILLDVVEDVFGNEKAGFPVPPETNFVPPSLNVLPLLATDAMVIDAPQRLVLEDGNLGSGNFGYPRVFVGLKGGVGGAATQFDLRVDAPKNAISPEFPSEKLFTSGMLYGVLSSQSPELGGWAVGNGTFEVVVDPPGSPIIAGALDTLIGQYTPGSYGALDGLCVINPGGANEEWIVTDTIVDSGGPGIRLQNVWRAALDTIMEPHVAGEEVWFIWTGGAAISESSYAAGQNYEVKILPRSNTDSIGLYDSPLPVSQADSTFDNPARASRPPPIVSITLQNNEFGTSVDLDSVVSTISPIAQGAYVTTRQKPYTDAADILLQVQGFKQNGQVITGTDFAAENWTVEWWLFDLDATPSPTRGVDDILSSGGPVQITEQNNPIFLDKSAISPVPTVNSFNARIEFQVKFDPQSTGTPIVARDDLQWDFEIIGTWVVPRDAVFLELMFNGPEDTRYIVDRSDNAFELITLGVAGDSGNTVTAPALSPGFPNTRAGDWGSNFSIRGGYCIDDVLNQGLQKTGRQFDWNDDWTIEFTWEKNFIGSVREGIFACQNSSAETVNGQRPYTNYDISWVGLEYDYTVARFQFRYTTTQTGNEGNDINCSGASLGFTTNQRYHVMITKKNNPDTTITFRTFINGIQTGGDNTVANFTVYDHYQNSPVRRVHMAIGWATTQLFRDLSQSSGGLYLVYLDRLRIILGYALEAIDYTTQDSGNFPHASGTVFHWGGKKLFHECRQTSDGGDVGASWGGQSEPEGDIVPFPGCSSIYCTGVGSTNPDSIGRPYWGTTALSEFHDINAFLGTVQNWTIECHAYFLSYPSDNAGGGTTSAGMALIAKDATNYGYSFGFYVDQENRLRWGGFRDGAFNQFRYLAEDVPSPFSGSPIHDRTSPKLIELERWYHLAAVRKGAGLSLYKDGVRVAYDDDFFTDPAQFNNQSVGLYETGSRYPICVGGWYDAASAAQSACMHGYIAEPRIVLDDAKYDGPTYTVPTEPFSAPRGNTWRDRTDQWSDHCVFYSRWNQGPSPLPVDESGVHTITLGGTATINTSIQKYGAGCLELLQGSPVQTAPAEAYAFLSGSDETLITTGTWAFDSWVRFNSIPASGEYATFAGVWNRNQEAGWRVGYDGDNGWSFEYSNRTSTNIRAITSGILSPEPVVNQWYHVRVSIWRGHVVLFIDGQPVRMGGMRYYNEAANINEVVRIGYSVFDTTHEDIFDGWLDEMQILQETVPNVGPNWDQPFTPSENFFPDVIFQMGVQYTSQPVREGFHFTWMQDISKNQCTNITRGSGVLVGGWENSLRPGGRDHFEYQYGSSAYTNYNKAGFTDNMLDGIEAFTIEGWFAHYSTSWTTRTETLLGCWENNASDRHWYLTTISGSDGFLSPDTPMIGFFWYPEQDGGATNTQMGLFARFLPSPITHNWHHIAVQHDGNGILTMYLDGVLTPWELFRDVGGSPGYQTPLSPNGSEFGLFSPNGIYTGGGSTAEMTVGALTAGSTYADIYSDDWRVTRGHAIYSGTSFTPPPPFSRLDTMNYDV